MKNFSDYIRKLRIEKDFTQDYMAIKLDMSISAYSKLERGQTDPTLSRIEKIAEVLGFQLSDYDAWKSISTQTETNELEDPINSSPYRFISKKDFLDMHLRLQELEKRIQYLEGKAK